MEQKETKTHDKPSTKHGMTITVHVGRSPSIAFQVPIGDGQQHVRWLGLVAAHRYSLQLHTNGRTRQRERSLTDVGNFLPGGVFLRKLDRGDPIDPSTCLCDVVEDGGELFVSLIQQVEIGDDGAPILSHWCSAAFKHTEQGIEQAREYQRRLKSEDCREGKFANDDEIDGKIIGDVWQVSADNLDTILEADWQDMNVSLLCDGNKSVMNQVRTVLRSHFLNLVAIMKRYLEFGTETRMSPLACVHCLHHSNIFSVEDQHDREWLQGKIDELATYENGVLGVSRHAFLDLLIIIASVNVPVPEIPSELHTLLEQIPFTSVEREQSTYKLHEALRTDTELRELVNTYSRRLQMCFKRYGMDALDHNAPPYMTLQELHLLFRDTDLVPGFDEVAKFQCTKDVFEASQLLNTVSSKVATPLKEIVFAELIDAIILVSERTNSATPHNFASLFRTAMKAFVDVFPEEVHSMLDTTFYEEGHRGGDKGHK